MPFYDLKTRNNITKKINNFKNFFFLEIKDKNLSPVGIRYIPNGYISPKKKLKIEFVIKIFWVFTYTAQKAEITYQ